MDIEFYRLIISLFIPLGLGYVLLAALFRLKVPEVSVAAALSFGLGCGILTHWMLVLDFLHIRFSDKTINVPLMVFLLLAGGVLLKSKGPWPRLDPGRKILRGSTEKQLRFSARNLFAVLCVIYVVVTVSYVFWRALGIPIQSYDALVKISYKAKIFFFDRKIHLVRVPHNFYPLHVPLLQTWAGFILGRWDECMTKIFFPFYFSSYLIVQYYFLKLIANKYQALLGTCLLISSNLFIFHATIAYMDFTLMYYNCVAILLMAVWYRSPGKSSWLVLAGFFSGIMTFVKTEGAVYLLIHFFLLLMLLKQLKEVALKEKVAFFMRFFIPGAGICAVFYLYMMTHGIVQFWHDRRMIWSFNPSSLLRLPQIISAYLNDLLLTGNWSLLWFLFFFVIIYGGRKNCFYARWFTLAIGLFFLVYTCLGLTTKSFAYIGGEYTEFGLSRLILHFFPLIIPVIILSYHKKMSDGSPI